MTNSVQSIPIEKLATHPDNPNEMSKANFGRLVRNIERSGRYEPLIVRPGPEGEEVFQIINGEHRYRALAKLGHKTADCIVWDVDDEQADILLSTLNRLAGTDRLSKKLKVLGRLRSKTAAKELARFLPQSAKQIERLNSMLDARYLMPEGCKPKVFAEAAVFFLSREHREIVEQALSAAIKEIKEETKAGRRAAALVRIAKHFIETSKGNSGI